MKRRAVLILVLVALAAAWTLPQPALAQHGGDGPILWISYITAEPGKSNDLGMHLASEGAKTYDGLVEDGHVMSWGVAQAINHFPGDGWTHLEFINFRDWAAVGEFINRFMGRMQGMSEEERKESAAKWDELTVHGSHFDVVARHHHLTAGAGSPSYISLSTFGLKPGASMDGLKAAYGKWRAPTMDKLLEDGQINAHGFYTAELHGPGAGNMVTAWYTVPGLASVDSTQAALQEANEMRSEEEQAAWLADMQKLMNPPGTDYHEDRILVVLHYNAAEAPSDEE